ncbi:MAG TPA: alanine--tRNA ligase-related protein, partial [Nitrososphaerales archaeon]|nr:alanine--tRNA ligase-related protein [Nitrososphaerales archaeon]
EKWLGIDEQRIYISVFAGDDDAPRDEESATIWRSVGVPPERISYLPKKDNWWGPAGETGPCGPDTEMFYDTGSEPCGVDCKPSCPCGKYFEIWNNVFMQYNKTSEVRYELLKQKNVDTGMGVERTIACLNHMKSVYEIETFKPIIEKIIEIAKIQLPLQDKQERSLRIIADHVKASTFILAEKIEPSNVERGYILRRLLRRAIRHGKLLGIEKEFLTDLIRMVIDIYKIGYPYLEQNSEFILSETVKEESKFRTSINRGLRKFNRIIEEKKQIDGNDAFLLFQSFGFPIEMTKELASEKGIVIDESAFEKEFKAHQETSRIGAEKRFKGNP